MNVRMSQRLFLSAVGAVAIAAGGLALRPSGGRSEEYSWSPLLKGAEIDRGTLSILERACQNCHSERTRWPWYSHVPPASWLVQRDVRQARAHLNLSRWQSYSPDERRALLSAIGAVARSGTMPPRRYLLLHSGSKLSHVEREQIYRWTRTERSRLGRPSHSSPKTQQMTRLASVVSNTEGAVARTVWARRMRQPSKLRASAVRSAAEAEIASGPGGLDAKAHASKELLESQAGP
jgi:hypothetical protein